MKTFLTGLLASAVAISFFTPVAHAACPQPVYVIAHRCNAGHWVPDVVEAQGVNGVEADFRWDQDGYWELGHDEVGHVPLDSWLWYVKAAMNKSYSPLALVVLDIKTPNSHLEKLYDQVRAALGPEINLIFSIGYYEDADDVYKRPANQGFITKLNEDPRAGAAIDDLRDIGQGDVQGLWNDVGVMDYWFADGIRASWPTTDTLRKNVERGIELRNDSLAACDARFHGVYTWTYEDLDDEDDDAIVFLKKNSTKSPIAGVNGLMVNASECFGFAGAGDSPSLAVDYTTYHTDLTGTKFADRAHNPFKVPAPRITECPTSTTVECSAPGGLIAMTRS